MREEVRTKREVLAGLGIVVLATLFAFGSGLAADGEPQFAVRAGGGFLGFPIVSGDALLEAAYGSTELSIVGYARFPFLPILSGMYGAQVSFSRSWIEVAAAIEYDPTLRRPAWTAAGRAAPAAWLVSPGTPLVLAGVVAEGEASWTSGWGGGRQQLTLSPYVTAVFSNGDLTVAASVGFEAVLQGGEGPGELVGTWLTSVLDVAGIVLTNAVSFRGAFGEFASLSVTLEMVDPGISVTGTMLPPIANDTWTYRVDLRFEFGARDLLPSAGSGNGLDCSGDTCYVP